MNDKTKEPEKGNVVDFNTLTKKPETIDFYKAIRQVMEGKKLQRKSWVVGNLKEFYVILRNDKLMLHKEDGKFYDWIMARDDVDGVDWVIV